jgi:hypothetical protein
MAYFLVCLFHHGYEGADIAAFLRNHGVHYVFCVNSQGDVVCRFQLAVFHMAFFHTHKGCKQILLFLLKRTTFSVAFLGPCCGSSLLHIAHNNILQQKDGFWNLPVAVFCSFYRAVNATAPYNVLGKNGNYCK